MAADAPKPQQHQFRAQRPKTSRGVWIAIALVSLGAMAIGPCELARSYHNAARAHRVQCAASLRQIGTAILVYASEPAHQGRFPDSFEPLLAPAGMIAQEDFTCIAEGYVPARGTTTRELAATFFASNPHAYVYLGKGLTNSLPSDVAATTPIAHEHLTTHGALWGSGMNILFADGHVQWFPADKAPAILHRIAAVTAATRPATTPTTTEAR